MSSSIASGLLAGTLGGVCGALIAVWLLGGSSGDDAALRTEIEALAERSETARIEIAERLGGVEARLQALGETVGGEAATAKSVEVIARDLRSLRDALRFELRAVDEELRRVSEAVSEVAGSDTGQNGGPLTPEQEPRWVVRSVDADPGVRFSALVRLGRRRTDRSVRASRERLHDDAPIVVWQALRNLGAFEERAAARDVARLLEHEQPVIRSAAAVTLVRLGAPADTGYDPIADPAERQGPAQVLRDWANAAE